LCPVVAIDTLEIRHDCASPLKRQKARHQRVALKTRNAARLAGHMIVVAVVLHRFMAWPPTDTARIRLPAMNLHAERFVDRVGVFA
jgi:hypothetical protein